MWNKLLKIGLFVAAVAILVFSMAFSSSNLSKVKCDSLRIVIPEGTPRFLTEKEIELMVKKADPKLFERTLEDINANLLEEKLEKAAEIENAEIYRYISGDRMDFKGHLTVEVYQRNPILRVRNSSADYYMDGDGVRIPASLKFAAHVLLVTGNVDEKYVRNELIPMVKFIKESKFWNAQIKQIDVSGAGEINMIPLLGDQLIEFGDASDYKEKFRNLKALYDQAFSEFGWNRYKKISLKYKNQVVCTKR